MKYLYLIILCCSVSFLFAQTEKTEVNIHDESACTAAGSHLTCSDSVLAFPIYGTIYAPDVLPLWNGPADIPASSLWMLHDGLNLQLSMAATIGFGRNRFSGALFSTRTSGAYVYPVTNRFRLVGGMYLDTQHWGGWHNHSLGITAMSLYQLTDRVTLGAYASKRLLPMHRLRIPLSLWGLQPYDYSFGGLVHVKCSDAFSFSVRVENGRY